MGHPCDGAHGPEAGLGKVTTVNAVERTGYAGASGRGGCGMRWPRDAGACGATPGRSPQRSPERGRGAAYTGPMSARLVREFPLFLLGIVALPSEVVPLHIFEERYKTMIDTCLDRGSEFGVVWLSDDGLRPVGCACEITDVLERMDDGRMNLIARGTRPFRIVERDGRLPYPAGTVEFLDDRDDPLDGSLAAVAREAYADLVERATDRRPEPDELAELDAYAMAATVDFGLEVKQGLLDIRSENARLRLVTRLFRAAMKRLELVARAQERARSNGKVRIT
mgnify:CR=1 FL=1